MCCATHAAGLCVDVGSLDDPSMVDPGLQDACVLHLTIGSQILSMTLQCVLSEHNRIHAPGSVAM